VGVRRTCCWAGRDRRAGRRPGGRRPGRGRVLVRRGEGRPGREGHDHHHHRRRRCRGGVWGRGSDHRRSLAGLASGGCGCGTREVEGEGETTRMEKGRDGAWACAGGLLWRSRWRAGAAGRGLQSVQGSPGPCEERGGDSEPLTESLPRLAASSLLSPTPSSLPAPLRAMNAPNGAIPLPTGLPSPSPDDLALDPEVEELWSSRALLLVRPHALAPSRPPLPSGPSASPPSRATYHHLVTAELATRKVLPPHRRTSSDVVPRRQLSRRTDTLCGLGERAKSVSPTSSTPAPGRPHRRAPRRRHPPLAPPDHPHLATPPPPRAPTATATARSSGTAGAPATTAGSEDPEAPALTPPTSSPPPTSLLSPSQVLLLLILSFWVSYYLKVRRIRSIHETIIAMFSGASFLLLSSSSPVRALDGSPFDNARLLQHAADSPSPSKQACSSAPSCASPRATSCAT